MTAAAAQLMIANLALAHLGLPQVETLALDDTTESARKLIPFLAPARDLVLARHGWRRAMTYATLPDSGEAGDWRFAYVHHLDAGALRVFEVDQTCGPVMWQAGSRDQAGEERLVVRANSTPVKVAYVRRLGWDGLPVHIYEPIACLAASRGALAIQDDEQKKQALAREYERLLAAAVAQDGTEGGRGSPVIQGRLAAARRGVVDGRPWG